MKVLIITVIVLAYNLAVAQKKLALLSAVVWECCKQILESLVMTSTKSIRLAEECLMTTGSTLLLHGVHQVYCDMELECGGHKGGWMRIADLDTSRGDNCPSGWTKITTNDTGQPSIDVCRSPSDNAGCYPTIFTVNGTSYHRICGKTRGYQKYTMDAFGGPRDGRSAKTIDDYVDGLSITLGKPRKHVWTYIVGFSEISNGGYTHYCPCATAQGGRTSPMFVGDHYYCESGYAGSVTPSNIFFTSDPLWDGSGYAHSTTQCCANINLPWFFRQFCMGQQDDIEVRICADEPFSIKLKLLQ